MPLARRWGLAIVSMLRVVWQDAGSQGRRAHVTDRLTAARRMRSLPYYLMLEMARCGADLNSYAPERRLLEQTGRQRTDWSQDAPLAW